MCSTPELPPIAPALLDWFHRCRRVLPFREDPTPYHVWVSEIMLQQTRVAAALPYYQRFIQQLPDIPALAACPEEKLHKLWEGLGYYSRVRNLHRAAQLVCQQYGGQLPADYDALLALPGIGEYTAGAIASIGFGLAVPAVDGNVLRVFARLYNDPRPVTSPAVKREITARVQAHQPADAPGDYNQALMELGALVCLPGGAPLCGSCPLAGLCRANAAHTAAALPCKVPAKARRVQPVTLAAAAASAQGPAGRVVAAAPVGGRSPVPRRAVQYTDRHRAEPGCRPPAAARGKAHLQPHRMAADRLACVRAAAGPAAGLRLGTARTAVPGIRPARRLQGLPALSAGAKIKVRLAARRHLNTCCFL